MRALKLKGIKLHNLFFLVISCLLVFVAILSLYLYKNAGKLRQMETARYKLYSLGVELKESSEELTKFSRTYVLTGDSVWEHKYRELLEIRNGKRPRPDGQTIALLDTFLHLGVSPAEYKKLSLAEKNSNDLVWTEIRAFNAMKGLFADSLKKFTIRAKPDTLLARKILYDPKYFADKEKIMRPIEDFRFMLDQRVSASISSQKSKNDVILALIMLMIILISVLSFYAILGLRKKIVLQIEQLEFSNNTIKENEERLILYNKELDAKVKEYNKKLVIKYEELSKYQDELNESREKYFTFFEQASDGILVTDMDGNILETNTSLSRLTGYSKQEMLLMKYSDLVAEKQPDSLPIDNNQKVAGDAFVKEIPFVTRSGKVVQVELHAKRIKGNRLLSICRDVTELNEAHQKIALSESNFRSAFEHSAMGMMLVSADGMFFRVNKKFSEIIGYSTEELLNMNFSDITHPEDKGEGLNFLKDALRGKSTTYITEKRYVHKNKQIIWVNLTSSAVTDAKNGVRYFVTQVEDITEKKESELKFKTLLEKSLVGIYIQTGGKKFQYVNPRMMEIFGYTEEELLQNPAELVIYEPDLPIVRDVNKQRFENREETTHYEVRGRKKDGTIIWLDIYGTLIVHKGEKAVIGNIQDITERKIIASQLKNSENKFRDLVEKNLAGVYIIDVVSVKHIYTNPRYLELFGYSQEEMAAIVPSELVHPEDRGILFQNIQRRLDGDMTSFHYTARGIRKSREMFWVEIFVNTTMVNGRLANIGTVFEITDRKKAEIELKESEEKFRSLVEQALVGVIILQEDKFKYVNPGFEKMSGYNREELLNEMPFETLIHQEDVDRVRKNYLNRINGEEASEQYTFKAIRKDGNMIYIEAIVSGIIYEKKPAVIGILVDITDRVEEEKRIGKAVNEAQENERMQIGMELHDNVKQIMAATLMALDIVKKNIDNNKERAITTIDKINDYINHAIVELRRLSHQLAPSIDTEDSLAEKIKALANDINKDNKIRFFVRIDKFEPPLKSEIQIAFYRMLQEQLTNIMKYANAASVSISIGVHDKIVYLNITDDGNGFDVTTKKDGIGLMNIRRRATVLGGKVNIVSSPGNGCEVDVQIPIQV